MFPKVWQTTIMAKGGFVQHIPGGYITLFVGGAVFVYIVGNSGVSETATTFSNDTVGLGLKTIPGGWTGLVFALFAAGSFLNERQFGKIT